MAATASSHVEAIKEKKEEKVKEEKEESKSEEEEEEEEEEETSKHETEFPSTLYLTPVKNMYEAEYAHEWLSPEEEEKEEELVLDVEPLKRLLTAAFLCSASLCWRYHEAPSVVKSVLWRSSKALHMAFVPKGASEPFCFGCGHFGSSVDTYHAKDESGKQWGRFLVSL